ncbi:hypothetical protein HZB03_04820 [Candidatus Woesearchaeota archaeon]|nr:hypothetical protein [Candidatus Woesearchaeota archaeon]
MGEIHIYDDILTPSEKLEISYAGKNPFLPMTATPSIIKEVLKNQSKDIHEFDVRWDGAGENRDFFGRWKTRRKEDQWTAVNIFITVTGTIKAADKTGNVKIAIKGYLETRYSFSNFIQKSFWWFYNYSFYFKQRRMYLEFAKDNMHDLKFKFQELMGISPDKYLERPASGQ